MSPRGAETASERRKDRWFWHRGEGGGPRRVATIASRVTTILGVADALIYGVDLATRPACPPRYVRLLDVEPALMGLSLVLVAAGAGLATLLFGRRRLIDRLGRAGIWIAIAFGTLLALLAFLLAMGGLWLMSIHVGGHEVTCWTF